MRALPVAMHSRWIIHSGAGELHVSAPEIVGFFANSLLKKGILPHIMRNRFIGRESFTVLPTHITKFRDYGITQSLIKSMPLLSVMTQHNFCRPGIVKLTFSP
ncbi:hypothetical protein POH93_07715 [Phytobacter diazotrophicus]|uniref:hypothetical protein n=1 Tax=Phytobacter diazotrophicus TaxID=395631 RepID=UPI0023307E3F|nr:hypothetical protein [Phytobacter diazotrophicus]MDC0725276.1 hypothetical protein [Phytobacter diazotrophicus]MDC0732820.1 hypothetical protein [Phytobacter diazotrophicus]